MSQGRTPTHSTQKKTNNLLRYSDEECQKFMEWTESVWANTFKQKTFYSINFRPWSSCIWYSLWTISGKMFQGEDILYTQSNLKGDLLLKVSLKTLCFNHSHMEITCWRLYKVVKYTIITLPPIATYCYHLLPVC